MATAKPQEDEIDRLWRALRRDLATAVLQMAGFDKDDKALNRLMRNWGRLCEVDLDIAARLYSGIEELSQMLGEDGPAERHGQQFDELIGIAEIARQAHPDAEVETLGELLDLGERSIADEIDREVGE